jgi:exodeoxyribonuclease VII small subunit
MAGAALSERTPGQTKAAKAAKGSARRKKGAPAAGAASAPDAAALPEAFAELGFEEALERLEGIVDQLEGGELDLADALARFEDGVALTRLCQEKLEAAERRVELLTRENGEWSTRSFAPADEEPDA